MKKKTSSIKKFDDGGSFTDKGKGKSSPSIMNKIDRGLDAVGNKIKSITPAPVKNAIKRGVKAVDRKINEICRPSDGPCLLKKGGTVGKSRRK